MPCNRGRRKLRAPCLTATRVGRANGGQMRHNQHDGASRMSGRRLPIILALGTTQTLAWASSYYLPAILADPIARDLGVSSNWIFAAFSGLAGDLGPARPAHRPADRSGRRPVGAVDFQSDAGGGTGAARLHLLRSRCWSSPGCCSASAWAAGLYDAAFGALGRIYGDAARALDHRHHADRGLCLHRRMAADRAGAGDTSAGATPALPGRRRIS